MAADSHRRSGAGGPIRALIGLLVAALVVTACRSPGLIVDRDIEYLPDRRLDVFRPDGEGPWPAIVLVHGAGLHRSDYEAFARSLAAAGAVVFNVDWDVLGPSTARSFVEIACAVRYAKTHGPALGADPERVVLAGHSTGAGYAGEVALAGDAFVGDCPHEGSALPQALAALSTAQVAGGSLWASSSLGGNPRLRIAIVHGEDDEAAPIRLAERSAFVLGRAGYAVTFETVPAGHFDLVMMNASPTSTPGEVSEAAARRTVDIVIALTNDG